MTILTDREKLRAVANVRELILAADEVAVLKRAVEGEQLYSSDERTFEALGTLDIEITPTPPEELSDKIDATACVLPEAGIIPQDVLVVDNVEYHIQSIRSERLFGSVTHKVLKLVRLVELQ